MSTGEKALGIVRTIFTFKDQLDGLGRDMAALNLRVSRLADAHGDLRDRVSRIEGYLGRVGSPGDDLPRIGK